MMTSACDHLRYSVTMAAIFFGSGMVRALLVWGVQPDLSPVHGAFRASSVGPRLKVACREPHRCHVAWFVCSPVHGTFRVIGLGPPLTAGYLGLYVFHKPRLP